MHYLDSNEKRQHWTGEIPLAYYYVDEKTSTRYRMPMHWHRETEIIRVISGRLLLYLDEAEFTLQEGDYACVGSGVIHGGEPDNCVYECMVLEPQAMAGDLAPLKSALRYFQRNNLLIRAEALRQSEAAFSAARALFSLGKEGFAGRELELAAAVLGLFGALLRQPELCSVQSVSGRTWEKAEQLKPALEYIEQHFNQSITLEMLASLSGFSPRYFCRYFKTVVHRTPIDYLNYYRVEYAARYLAGSAMNVAEVAALCGYADSSTFIKQFRQYKGETPKQYKLRIQRSGES